MPAALHSEDLQREAEKGRLLVVAGTGVSLAATKNKLLASWAGLLHHGVDYCQQLDPALTAEWVRVVHAARLNLHTLTSGFRQQKRSLIGFVLPKAGTSNDGSGKPWEL